MIEELTIKSAEEELTRRLKKLGVDVVNLDPVHKPFTYAVKISWPKKQGEKLSEEIKQIAESLENLADKYSLRLKYAGPIPNNGQLLIYFNYSAP